MKTSKIRLAGLLLISLVIYSCTITGVEHYYKSGSDKWMDITGYHDTVFYGNTDGTPLLEINGKDSFILYNIIATTVDHKSWYAIGFYYIPIIPVFMNMFNNLEFRYFIDFKFKVKPRRTRVEIVDIRFYINDDSVSTLPNYIMPGQPWIIPKPGDTSKSYYNRVDTVIHDNTFFYRFDIRTPDVKKIRVEFKNVTINGIKFDIPDLVLERDWRFYDTMQWLE
jgi:hypothetical protein